MNVNTTIIWDTSKHIEPCPKCQCSAFLILKTLTYGYRIGCSYCMHIGPLAKQAISAINAWNKRKKT